MSLWRRGLARARARAPKPRAGDRRHRVVRARPEPGFPWLALVCVGGALSIYLLAARRQKLSERAELASGPKSKPWRWNPHPPRKGPKGWYNRKSPAPRNCYRVKADALRSFLDANSDLVESYGGEGYEQPPQEFDAINHLYSLEGKRRARSIADASWYALKGRGHRGSAPYCLDDIDLETLNRTAPGQYHGGFVLPGEAIEAEAEAEEEREWTRQAVEEYGYTDCFYRKPKKRGGARKRQLSCVCRDSVGKFARCESPAPEPELEEVPF